jgi:hypothetical protein
MKLCAVLSAVVFLWLQPLFASDDAAKKQDAMTKIEQAVAKTNIFDLPSFEMKAKVEIETQGKSLEGSYELSWNGPSQWREEIKFPGYAEVQVGGRGNLWLQRSTDFLPLRIYDLHSALGFASSTVGSLGASSGSLVQLPYGWRDTARKIRQHGERGEVQTCVEYENDLKRSLEICMDENSGVLYRDPVSYQGKDIQPVGGEKEYPRSLSFMEDGKPVAKVTITELVTPAHFQANTFDAPAGISARPGCMNPVSARLVKKVNPEYPQTAVHHRTQGLVAVDAMIGVDGVPRLGKLASHTDPELERTSLDAIKGWRFACHVRR